MRKPAVSRCSIWRMIQWRTKAATAAKKPTKKLSNSVNCLSLICSSRHFWNRGSTCLYCPKP